MKASRLAHRWRLRSALAAIPGWLFEREAWRLHELARVAAASGLGTVVEIGSFHGRSTIALAKGIEAGGEGGHLYTIDPQGDDRHHALLANLERAGVADLVEPVRTTSSEARRRLGEIEVGMLFVDGSHEYEDVVRDLTEWSELLEPGAVVALNDPFWRGVNLALRDRLARRGSPYRAPAFIANTLFVRYQPGAEWRRADSWSLVRLRAVLAVGGLWYRRYHEPVLASRRVPQRLRPILVWPPVWVLTRIFGLLLPGSPRESAPPAR